MKTLVIKYLGEENRLALVYSNSDGSFEIDSSDREVEDYFSRLVNGISRDNPTLTLTTGESEKKGNIITEKTLQRRVRNTDVEYLSALWDYLNKNEIVYKGRKVQIYVADASEVQVNAKAYKDFLIKFMDQLESLFEQHKLNQNAKLVSELRIAERTFNFLLNFFPHDKVSIAFGLDEWTRLKNRRDNLASGLADLIESDEKIKKRYEGFCDNLKNSRILGSML